jgi:hypothetical protein
MRALGACVFLLIVSSGAAFGQPAQPVAAQAAAAVGAVEAPMAAPPSQEEAAQEAPKEPDEMDGLRDPFLTFLPIKIASVVSPQGEAVVEEKIFDTGSLHVTGLMWGTDTPRAIINGEIMGKGAKVRSGEGEGALEAEIKDISKEGIILRCGNRDYILHRLAPGSEPPPS